MPESESKITEQFPFGAGLAVWNLLRAIVCCFCSPESVYSQILIQNHEQVIKPTLTEALIAERKASITCVAVLFIRFLVIKNRQSKSHE